MNRKLWQARHLLFPTKSDRRSTPEVKTVPRRVRRHTEARKLAVGECGSRRVCRKLRVGKSRGQQNEKRPLHLADAAAFWKMAFEAKNYALRRLRASAPSPMNRPPTMAIVAGSGTAVELRVP